MPLAVLKIDPGVTCPENAPLFNRFLFGLGLGVMGVKWHKEQEKILCVGSQC